MSSTFRTDRDRGIKEYRQQLAELRKRWPRAFPVDDEDVRPLAVDATHEIAAAKGWSLPYTLGVLRRWKMAPVYCQSILCYDQRIALDGTPAGVVEAKAKDWRPSTLRGSRQARPRRRQRRLRRLHG